MYPQSQPLGSMKIKAILSHGGLEASLACMRPNLNKRAGMQGEMALRVRCSWCKPENLHLDAQANTTAGQSSEGIQNFRTP